MKIFGLGVPELIIILVVILIIFGPKQLPKLGALLGKTVKSIRSGLNANKEELSEVEETEDDVNEQMPYEEEQTSALKETSEKSTNSAKHKTVKKIKIKK